MPMMIPNQKLNEVRKTKDVSLLSEVEILALIQEVLNSRKYLAKVWQEFGHRCPQSPVLKNIGK